VQCARKNGVWSQDAIFDRTVDGRQLKIFAVIDQYTRECLLLNVSRQFQACDVVVVLDELIACRDAPTHLRSDNGSEFVTRTASNWCKECKTGALFIEPGAPW
jgi:putative transposase